MRGSTKETTAMLSKRFWIILREKANTIPTKSLWPRLWSLIWPNIKEVASKIRKIEITGWKIFLQYSNKSEFFLYAETSSSIASLSSNIEKYSGDSIRRISFWLGAFFHNLFSSVNIEPVITSSICKLNKVHVPSCLIAVFE